MYANIDENNKIYIKWIYSANITLFAEFIAIFFDPLLWFTAACISNFYRQFPLVLQANSEIPNPQRIHITFKAANSEETVRYILEFPEI